MAYADFDNLTNRYDVNLVKELIQDVGDPTLFVQAIADAALADASGWIDSACSQASRYTDLTSLSDNSQSLLVRITCDLAFSLLRQRRGRDVSQMKTVENSYEMLNLLRRGERIFDDGSVPDAGLPDTDKITAAEAAVENGILYRSRRYYAQC